MPVQAWVLLACACGGFPPLPPYTTRSVESGWGGPVNGLSLLFAADADSVPLGGRIRAEMFFRYSPFLAGRTGVVLVGDERTERWTLVLRDLRTGTTWERFPYDVGMPSVAIPYGKPRPLPYGPAGSRAREFILLSSDGEQVPAGTYVVTVRYTNDGSPGERAVLDPTRVRIPDEDPSRPLWRGTLETPPVRMRVLPRDADTTVCELPAAVLLEWREDRGTLEWRWPPDDWETATIVSRPGYTLGCAMDFDWFVGTEPFPGMPVDGSREEQDEYREVWGLRITRSRGGLPARDHPPAGQGSQVGGHRFREVLDRGEPVSVVVRARIFETSEPSGHLWMPESGDYRVLREWEIRGRWP